ncbi:hypothetical protein CEXT_621231 [Caerostris extrusa]|uniref:Uncharacterized protein n=1 Tax=Caerostris extrusa TaxID=172846 RepID=A0AAV4WJA3_CAEEX|nr:hypothetical protein CEXT_621231 [Caerostris extrusa]
MTSYQEPRVKKGKKKSQHLFTVSNHNYSAIAYSNAGLPKRAGGMPPLIYNQHLFTVSNHNYSAIAYSNAGLPKRAERGMPRILRVPIQLLPSAVCLADNGPLTLITHQEPGGNKSMDIHANNCFSISHLSICGRNG